MVKLLRPRLNLDAADLKPMPPATLPYLPHVVKTLLSKGHQETEEAQEKEYLG